MLEKNWPTVTANEDSYRIGGESQQSKCLSAMARRGEMDNGQAAPASSSSLGSRQGLSWMTPRACEAQNPPMGVDKRHHGLTHQVTKQWGTPTARDYKSGRGNEEREYKELTPMVERQQSGKLNPRWVETLMGLPIGWTMPSCIRPVTIELMSCGASGTELFRPLRSVRGDFLLASCGNWTTPNQVDATIEKGALRPSRIATGRKTDYLARQVQMQLK